MLAKSSIIKALSFATFLSLGEAAALPEPVDLAITTFSHLQSRILGNEASSLICVTPDDKKCGIYMTYTNGQKRETVKYQTGGRIACAFQMLRKKTNENGFWADLEFFGTAGFHIGFNPTRQEIALGDATFSNNNQDRLNGRCRNEFGWTESVDVAKSGEAFWGNLDRNLY